MDTNMRVRELVDRTLDVAGSRGQHLRAIGAYETIVAQLEFMSDVYNGRPYDHARLHDINVGVIALREIGDSDEEFASLLRKVQYVASRKAAGLKVDTSLI